MKKINDWTRFSFVILFSLFLLALIVLMFSEIPSGWAQANNGVVFWNKLGSDEEIQNSVIGPSGTRTGGAFTAGKFGGAYLADHTEDGKLTFPAYVIPAARGTIDFWAQLINMPEQLDSGVEFFGREHLRPNPRICWRLGISANNGCGGGGLFGTVGVSFNDYCSKLVDVAMEWYGWGFRYDEVLSPGSVEAWHHYAIIWDENGLSIAGGQRAAIFLDGKMVATRWQDYAGTTFDDPADYPGHVFELLWIYDNQGMVAMDNLIIRNVVKTDFSDRGTESPLSNGTNPNGLVLWNKMGSDQEVLNSEVGPNGVIVGSSYAFEPGKFGNGYVRKAIDNNYIEFPASIVDGLRDRGCIELWINPKVPHPVPYEYGVFGLVGTPYGPWWLPEHPNSNIELVWEYWDEPFGYNGRGFSGRIRFDNNEAGTPFELSPFVTTPGVPFHAAISWDIDGINDTNDTIRVYRDGNMVGSTTTEWNRNGPYLYSIVLGFNPDDGGYDKFITDNIIIWNYAKTDFSNRETESPLLPSTNINTNANFPDPNFRAFVEQFMGVLPGGEFTAEQAAAKTGAMNCSNRNIGNLKGIEFFTGIRRLNCSSNALQSLDVSSNTALTLLRCDRNYELTSLNISKNLVLRELYCSFTKLSALDLSNNINLTMLFCIENTQLTSIDISHNTALKKVNFSKCRLTSLDVSNNADLGILICSFNQLTSLDVSNKTRLWCLICSNNHLLSNLNLTNTPSLSILYCNVNQLSDLDVSDCTALNDLYCAYNPLTNLDISSNPALHTLRCSYNNLRSLDVSQNPQLSYLDIRKNNLDCGDWNEIVSMRNWIPNFYYSPQWGYDPYDCSSDGTIKKEITVPLALPDGATPLEMVLIPAGTFMMGSPETERNRVDGETQHEVTLTNDFYIGRYEITQAQYELVMGNNPASGYGGGSDYPVYYVSWYDAASFCNRLSERIGYQKVYNESNWEFNMNAKGFRLPTEAEWEYACRAGTSTRFSHGDVLECDDWYCTSCSIHDQYMWWCGNSGYQSHEAGLKLPNPWGLYDMHGNVGEWCQDWHGNYPSGNQVNPIGIVNGSFRVLRGGRWDLDAWACRSAFRARSWPGNPNGFRVVLLRTP